MAKTKYINRLVVDGKVMATRTGKRILKEWQKLSRLKGVEIKTEEVVQG